MSDTIVLDTPEQISMWVLLSRRHQLQLHMKGLKVPGIVKACREQIPGCASARTAKDCVIPVEFAISQAGGEIDYKLVNVHIMEKVRSDVFQDLGIYNSVDEAGESKYLRDLFAVGRLEVVLTLDPVRNPTGEFFAPA